MNMTMSRPQDAALSDALAGFLVKLHGYPAVRFRGGAKDSIRGDADRFVKRLAEHLEYSEESLFPALLHVEPRSACDVEKLKKDHLLLDLYARDLALQIRGGDKEGTYGIARSFLAVLLDHIHREKEGMDRFVESLDVLDARLLSAALEERHPISGPGGARDSSRQTRGIMMEDSLKRYSKEIAGGLKIRPMLASDEQGLLSFFKRLPVDERQLFSNDVTQVEVIRGWIRNLDYKNILPLLVFDGARIVADASLHRDRRGWARHVATLRITIDPDYRGRGLARTLVGEFVELCGPLKIAILQAEILDVQEKARGLFEDLGFQSAATLTQHAIDLAGRVHDILIYTLTVTPPEELAPEARVKEADADVGGG